MSKLGLIGTLNSFDVEADDFNLYSEQLEHFFLANDVEEDKKVSVFISAIGSKTYKLLRNLLLPKPPSACTYAELTQTLSQHFKPAPIIIAERFRFHRRNQTVGETVSQYLVELRRLASTCNFGAFLDEALRDRFVCGLNNENIQKRLLAKKDLKLSDAVDTAIAIEIAENDAANMKNFTPSVNKVRQSFSANKKNQHQPSKNVSANTQSKKFSKCFRCGAAHDPAKCKYKSAKCHFCGKVGHISPVCMSKNKGSSTKKVEVVEYDSEASLYAVKSINQVSQSKKYIINVTLNEKQLDMELDTAADVSIASEQWVNNNLPEIKIVPSSTKLKDYNEKEIPVVGEINADVQCNNQCFKLPLIIVKGDRPALFGKNWLSVFKLNWNEIFSVSAELESRVEALKRKFIEVFQVSDQPIKHFKAVLKMKDNCQPVFCKARPVPYALKNSVCDEIKKLVKNNTWQFVEHSNWATPVVVVPKKNNSVRLCGDFKVTVNKYLDPHQYPLPTQQDLFATLRGGKYFSKLDLSQAYQQIELDANSQELLTLNTIMGLVRPNRLMYGISAAAAIFQSTVEQILQGIPGVICFQDDILISSATEEEHFSILGTVMTRLQKYNAKLNSEKCHFFKSSVEFLGHIIDETGIHPTQEKLDAIRKIKTPENVSQLKSFLGLLNYYSKFIKNSATLLSPLYNLLNKNVPWTWSEECNSVFQQCKQLLTSDAVLTHYNEKLPLQVSCDASPVGLGAVLSHIVNGAEKPVAYASRTLSKAEVNYSQTEKEALAIIFACKKFHQYLFGRNFVLYTDHQPLVTIFSPTKAVPTMAAARLQRWALLLSSHNYTIKYKKGDLHQNADSLSRLPTEDPNKDMYPSDIYKISHLSELPVTSDDIASASRIDKVLGIVIKYVQGGFPSKTDDPDFKPFFSRKDELSVDRNCLLWGMRVVIPNVYRKHLLELLHDTHPGIVKMKAVARSHFWWPHLDQDIENLSANCEACQLVAKSPPVTPLQSWVWPKAPWDRIHLDFAQKDKIDYLIIVDSHSKWLEVAKMSSTSAASMIAVLQQLFSRYGLPLEVVSDNGPQFISKEFRTFLKSVGILQTLTPAYHPQSNGQAERTIQTFKQSLSKMLLDSRDGCTVTAMVNRFLFKYRSSPHSTTGSTPAELFLGRPIRTILELLHPCTARHVEKKQRCQKQYFDRSHTSNKSLSCNQEVWIKSHKDHSNKWVRGRLIKPKGSKTWLIEIEGKRYLAHIDQIRPANSAIHSPQEIIPDDAVHSPQDVVIPVDPCATPQAFDQHTAITTPDSEPQQDQSSTLEIPQSADLPSEKSNNIPVTDVPTRRYPTRIKKKPNRLNL